MKIKLSITLALLLCMAILCSCSQGSNRGKLDASTTKDPYVSADTENISHLLIEGEDMGKEYIDSFLFFGESTTYHLKSRGVLSGGTNTLQVLGDRSGTAILDTLTHKMNVVYPETGELMPIYDAVRLKKPRYMLLCFGLNGAVQNVRRGEKYFKDCYLSLINVIRDASPETKIILQSCYPVAECMDMSNYSVSAHELNGLIDTLNSWSFQLAKEEELRYLNTSEILKDDRGFLRPEYQVGDGHHLTRETYIKVIEYIRTHGYK